MQTTIERKTIEEYLLQTQKLKKESPQDLLPFIEEQIVLYQGKGELESFFKGERAFYSHLYERALMLYMQARTLDLFEFFCYRATAFLSFSKGNSKKAHDFLEKALEIIPEDAASQELKKEISSLPLQETSSESSHSLPCNLDPSSPLLPEPTIEDLETSSDELEAHTKTYQKIYQQQIESYLESFPTLSTKRNDALWVFDGWETSLKQEAFPWNLPASSEGLYLRWNGKGIVLNPGEHFLKRFHAKGIHFRQINIVIATEYSPSIQSGIEQISLLNSQLNGVSSSCHLIHYYLQLKAYQKLAHHLKPRFKQEKNTVHSLEVFEDSSEVESLSLSEDIHLSYWMSTSSNLHSTLAIKLALKAKDDTTIQWGYLTCSSPCLSAPLKALDGLLIHLRGSDLNVFDPQGVPRKFLSEINELIRIKKETQPKFLLLMGFEERLGDLRLEIARRLRKEHDQSTQENSVVLPADCGMIMDLKTGRVKCSLSEEMLDPLALQITKTGEMFSPLHYFSPDALL